MSLLSILLASTTYFAVVEFFYNFYTKPLNKNLLSVLGTNIAILTGFHFWKMAKV